ncbi:SHUGOSHIN 2-like isoform X1 [Malus sylvestris]|uniref:SHUGOSHIN 2-like isoform X1 n=1 Tax=Malus sylvestris TaxID=3752 RepID=UPI0021AC8A36|nr:SHUGOSHIN 2-like isoform X1 [Malus sylvestris]
MEGLIILDTENSAAGDNKAKGGKISKGLSIGSSSRKRLADISNLQQQWPKPSVQQEKQQFDSDTNKEYIDNLQKENRTLMKLLTDRNKIIELSRVEIQKLRINLQKVQQQNLQLAQANSQIVGELNSGKDRLKALQHEIGCKNGLLNVRKLEAEGRAKRVTCQSTENQVEGSTKCVEAGESLQADNEDGPCNTKRERHPKNPPVASHTVEAVEVKVKADNKRRLRRQSARFKTEEHEATEEMLATNVGKIPVSPICDNVVHESETAFSLADKEAPTIEAVQANEKANNKRRFTRQSARLKTEEQEANEFFFETNGYKIPVSPLCDNVVHESETTCSLGEKEDPTIEELQPKGKAENKRRFTRQSARLKTEEQAPEVLFETNGEEFPVPPLCQNVAHESAPTCSMAEKEDPITEAVHDKEKADNKRRLTRQTTKFKTEEQGATEASFEINDDTVHASSPSDEVVHESGLTCSSVKKDDGGYIDPRSEGQECRKSSARPLRRATQKIQSYKEIPVNVKMRRE